MEDPAIIAKGVTIANKLLADGVISPEHHSAAVAHCKRTGVRMEEILLESRAVPEADLLKNLAAMYGTKFISTEKLGKANVDRGTLEKINRKFAEKFGVVPVMFDAATNVLSIVTADPDNMDTLEQVQKATRARQVKPLVARPAAVKAALAKFYAGDAFAFIALEKKVREEAPNVGLELGMMFGDEPPPPKSAMGGGISMPPPKVMSTVSSPARGHARPILDLELPATQQAAPAQQQQQHQQQQPPQQQQQQLTTSEPFIETFNVLITLLENDRGDLRGHSAQVGRLVRKLGERIGLAPSDVNAMVVASHLHDLGKMAGYHLTLLNASEFEQARAAAQKTCALPTRLMQTAKLAPTTISALESMYERFDGGGFPIGMKGKEIPLGARVLSLVDTYLDLTQNPNNPFRKPLTATEACDVLAKYKASIFDPHLVDLFRTVVAGDDLRARILSDRRVALLVDPDPEETTVLELRMIEEGFDVRIARDGQQALKVLEKGEIEVVVSEIDFTHATPGASGPPPAPAGGGPADGLALLQLARKAPWGKDLPWLILTRRQERVDAQRSFELHVVDFVIKPAPTEVLVAKLKQSLDKRATAAPARGVSGSLAEMALPDLVQILWHGRKSGALRIRRALESGEIHFTEGKIVDAVWGKLRGEEAIYAMLTLAEGEFAMDPNFKTDAVVITTSPEALLLEGMRRLDEATM
jgi:response regulator RpfG family c-di-GMP phosphodiesterase